MLNKIINVIHHNKDADGFLSLHLFKALINIANKSNDSVNVDINVIGYNYEHQTGIVGDLDTDEHWLTEDSINNNYVFLDCTPPNWWLVMMNKYDKLSNILIIDHHKTVCESIIEQFPKIDIIYTNGISASMLTYNTFINDPCLVIDKYYDKFNWSKYFDNIKYIYDDEIFREIVQLVNDYDIWDWYSTYVKTGDLKPKIIYTAITEIYTNKDYLEIQNSLGINSQTSDKLSDLLNVNSLYSSTELMKDLLRLGNYYLAEEIKTYQDTEFSLIHYFDNTGLISIALINSQVNFFTTSKILNSNLCVDVCMYYNPIDNKYDMFKLNMRSESDIDVAKLMNKFTKGNGGGHFSASGGVIDIFELSQLISDTFIIKEKNIKTKSLNNYA